MKFKINSEETYNSNFNNIVEFVLAVRGIKDVEAILKAHIDQEESYKNLENIVEGAKLLLEIVEKDGIIGLIVDSDCDGLTSSVEFYNYMKKVLPNCKIELMFHEGKTHGIHSSIDYPKMDLLVVLDGGTSNVKEQRAMVEKGVKVLVVDHHQLEEGWETVDGAIIINNQMSPNYKNKSISGSGVTFKFLQCLDDLMGINVARDYVDLCGLGCISDHMDSKELDTRALMNQCLTNITNPMLKKLVAEKILKYNKLNIGTMAWNVVPLINAVFRSGSLDEKRTMFEGFISEDEDVIAKAYKVLTSCKSRQDKEKKVATEDAIKFIDKNGLNNNPIILLDSTDIWSYNNATLNGVICNSLSSIYNKPIIIVGGNGDLLSGSVRNSNLEMCDNFRQWCLDSNLFELASGHANSHGVVIKRENMENIVTHAKETFRGDFEKVKTHMVDAIIDFEDLRHEDVIAIGDYIDLWGTTIREPIFAIRGIRINNSKIEKKGSKQNVMMFNARGFGFIKNFLSKDFFSNFSQKSEIGFGGKELEIDVVVKFKRNDYNGNTYAQLEIVDGESVEVEEILF